MPTAPTATRAPVRSPAALQGRGTRLGYAAAIVGSLLFAVNGSVSKVVLTERTLDAQRLTELRTSGAWLGLAVLLLLTAPKSLRISWREVPYLAAYGLIGAAMVQWLYLVAIGRLPVGIALLFEYTAPVLVALWARFVLREPVRRRVWGALALALGGLALIAQVWQGLALDGLGVLAGLGAAVALAAYYLLGEHGVRTRDPLSLTCWTFLFGALFWSIMQPWWTFDPGVLTQAVSLPASHVQAPTWALVLWIVALGTVAPYVLILYALRHLPALRVGIVGMLEPVLATVVAWIWLGEALSGVQLLGAGLVLTGIVAAQTARRADTPPAATPS
jgi:drug/metabolite transporter (DMT)-like permease